MASEGHQLEQEWVVEESQVSTRLECLMETIDLYCMVKVLSHARR